MKRSGFATILAIAAVGFVSAALAALAIEFSGEVRRAAGMRVDGQIRQMLLAGAKDVSVRSKTWGESAPNQGWSVSLPDELRGQEVSLNAQISAAGASVHVTLTCIAGRAEGREELELRRGDSGWVLAGARMEGTVSLARRKGGGR